MSASSKKKLRKEQEAALLTEKQLSKQTEQKKLKVYSITFIAVIAVIVAAALVILGVTTYGRLGIAEKNTIAATFDGEDLNSVDLSYYFVDAAQNKYNEWYSTYGNSLAMFTAAIGFDTSLPMDEQYYDEEAGITWSDYFMDIAIAEAKSDIALCHLAEKENFVVPQADLDTMEDTIDTLIAYVEMNGYTNLNQFLRNTYSAGANEENFREYALRSTTAAAYYNAYANALTYDDTQIRAYEADKYSQYSSFSYATYYVSYADFLQGGTEDENGNVSYTDEQRNAARAVAKEKADELAALGSLEALKTAVAEMPENASKETPSEVQEFDNTLYSDVNEILVDWIADEARKEGDMTSVASTATNTDSDGNKTETVYGYYVVLFQGRNDNLRPLANVRHLLVALQADEGATSYTEENIATARNEATALLEQWRAGDATEESFIELVKEHTDDTASAEIGGLYENITPQKGIYMEEFTDWAVEETRTAGDTGIIQTDYGFHIMYYVGDGEQSYRDYMITYDMRAADAASWYEEVSEAVTYTEGDMSKINMGLVLTA